MRKAFSLLSAIVIMVMMAAIASLVFDTTGKMVKETTAQYKKEQAILLARSATEYVVLQIQNSLKAGGDGCFTGSMPYIKPILGIASYITYTTQFIGPASSSICTTNKTNSNSDDNAVIIDIDVTYGEPDTTLLMHYRRRTLQGL